MPCAGEANEQPRPNQTDGVLRPRKCAAARAPPAAEPARLQGQGANTAGAADGQAPADEADRHQKRRPGVLPLALAERVDIYTVCAHVEL